MFVLIHGVILHIPQRSLQKRLFTVVSFPTEGGEKKFMALYLNVIFPALRW